MRILLLLCLLALGSTKPYRPINVMDFMKSYEIMMADSSDEDDDDDGDDKDDYDDEDENCPPGCHCLPQVVQCSDKGQNKLDCISNTGLSGQSEVFTFGLGCRRPGSVSVTMCTTEQDTAPAGGGGGGGVQVLTNVPSVGPIKLI